jgi:UDP-N-acetylmuramate dehydrogenase
MTIDENVMLGPLTTLKIGGPARWFVRVADETQLVEAVTFAKARGLRMVVLGGGSNLVVADAGFDGLVVQVGMDGAIGSEVEAGSRAVLMSVAAGVDWDHFVDVCCVGGLCGVECLAGIPGTVGGSPVQNIGAYGQEVADSIRSVRALDCETMAYVTLTAAECGFGYRRSIFNTTQRDRYIVTAVTFGFDPDAKPKLDYADLKRHFEGRAVPTPVEVYEAVREIRAGKGMLVDPERLGADARSAGSFFKNPVVAEKAARGVAEGLGLAMEAMPHWPGEAGRVKLSAAWLIDEAGFSKGFAMGRVGISSRHTLALINRTGDASCEELMRLKDLIVMTVEDRFRVSLVQEPVMLG